MRTSSPNGLSSTNQNPVTNVSSRSTSSNGQRWPEHEASDTLSRPSPQHEHGAFRGSASASSSARRAKPPNSDTEQLWSQPERLGESGVTDFDLTTSDATSLAAGVRSRHFSARQLVEATVRRIDQVEPSVNAFRVVLANEALEQADRIDSLSEPGGARPAVLQRLSAQAWRPWVSAATEADRSATRRAQRPGRRQAAAQSHPRGAGAWFGGAWPPRTRAARPICP